MFPLLSPFAIKAWDKESLKNFFQQKRENPTGGNNNKQPVEGNIEEISKPRPIGQQLNSANTKELGSTTETTEIESKAQKFDPTIEETLFDITKDTSILIDGLIEIQKQATNSEIVSKGVEKFQTPNGEFFIDLENDTILESLPHNDPIELGPTSEIDKHELDFSEQIIEIEKLIFKIQNANKSCNKLSFISKDSLNKLNLKLKKTIANAYNSVDSISKEGLTQEDATALNKHIQKCKAKLDELMTVAEKLQ